MATAVAASRKPRLRPRTKISVMAMAAMAVLCWMFGVWGMLNLAREGTHTSNIERPSGVNVALARERRSGVEATSLTGDSPSDIDARGRGDKRNDGSSSAPNILDGKRILYAVASYNQTQIPYPMIAALRDVCEHGARVDIVVYSTFVWPVDFVDDVNGMTRCRHPRGSVQVTVRLKSAEWRDSLVDFHRKLFYENLDSYDLFVYTEDDQLVRSTNIVAYLDETEKVRRLVGPDRFADYSVGFLRFEVDGTAKPHARKKWIFEHKWPKNDMEPQIIRDDGLDGMYFTTPGMHHQGMFMATPEQLRAWRNRKPDCHFDTIEKSTAYFHKIRASSVHLFRKDAKFGCNVTQLLPIDSFDDFLIHHLSNKYWNTMKYKKLSISTSPLRTALLKAQMGLAPEDDSESLGGGGDYEGVRMFNDEKEKALGVNLFAFLKYVSAQKKANQQVAKMKPDR